MTHVRERLAGWLAGELDDAARTAVEAHLAACPDCCREADRLRTVWQALGAAAPAAAGGSVWPAVRARTLGGRRGWYFAGRPLVQASLGAVAVACGLAAAVLLPAGGRATAADTTLWASASRVLADEASGALDIWLAPGTAADAAAAASPDTEATR